MHPPRGAIKNYAIFGVCRKIHQNLAKSPWRSFSPSRILKTVMPAMTVAQILWSPIRRGLCCGTRNFRGSTPPPVPNGNLTGSANLRISASGTKLPAYCRQPENGFVNNASLENAMNRFLLTCVCLASALLAASAAVAENITIADSATFNANVTITGVNTFAGLGVPDGGYVIVNTLAGLPNNTRDAATNTSVTADGIALNLTPDDSLGDVYSCGYLVRGDAGCWGDIDWRECDDGVLAQYRGLHRHNSSIWHEGTALRSTVCGRRGQRRRACPRTRKPFGDATSEDVLSLGKRRGYRIYLGVATTTPGATIASVYFHGRGPVVPGPDLHRRPGGEGVQRCARAVHSGPVGNRSGRTAGLRLAEAKVAGR